MKKILISASFVAVALVSFAGPVAASSPSVRLPKSAADWATFTAAEEKAAYDWVYENEIRPSTVAPTIVSVSTSTMASGVQPMAATGLTVSGRCGFSVVNYAHGTAVAGWSQVSTSQAVYWLDTGMQGYIDQLWRNGVKSYTTYAGRGNANYVYASTNQDFKWFWEGVHYTFQAWDSVETSAGVWYWKNAYCVANYDA